MTGLDQAQWLNLWENLSSREGANDWFERLTDLYNEPHRWYHNARHIVDCLNEFESARRFTNEADAVEWAIWFHDAIYDPRAADNEERSADLARQCCQEAGLGNQFSESVSQLILSTKTHDISMDSNAPLIVDVDLSIFGQGDERFWEYESQIRKEYSWVPSDIFAPKRAEILEGFLSRNKIFAMEVFFNRYEHRARRNLQASVQKLRAELKNG